MGSPTGSRGGFRAGRCWDTDVVPDLGRAEVGRKAQQQGLWGPGLQWEAGGLPGGGGQGPSSPGQAVACLEPGEGRVHGVRAGELAGRDRDRTASLLKFRCNDSALDSLPCSTPTFKEKPAFPGPSPGLAHGGGSEVPTQ